MAGCSKRRGVVARFADRLNLEGKADPVSLCEGGTPLIPLPRLAEVFGGGFELYAKFEGLNPTASFKDRGMCAAVTEARARGAKALLCASTGNTAASAAAYAARAGMSCLVVVPEGKIALGKLAGAIAYGAKVVMIEGSFDVGLRMVREAADRSPIALVNSVNPARIEGQKTASFEIVEDLGDAPDILALPIGNAGNITAYWQGFREDRDAGNATRLPRCIGAQAEGAAPLVLGHPVEHPETVATAIRIGNPARWKQAEAALAESGGEVHAASDREILHQYRQLARLEGVFCEPSSAAGLAGLGRAICLNGLDVKGLRVVTVLTGHGLKDPDSAVPDDFSPVRIAGTTDALLEVIG
ncbi:MAG: threonine synthase [Fimbriimonadaceae bacterium]|nr:threonine synthase [Fimbriimonadaceae bacterium]